MFDNKDRKRYYGLRIGDEIEVMSLNGTVWGNSEVLDYDPFDNNKVIIKSKNGNPIDWVAEWCKVIKRVEDKEAEKTTSKK